MKWGANVDLDVGYFGLIEEDEEGPPLLRTEPEPEYALEIGAFGTDDEPDELQGASIDHSAIREPR